MDDYVLMMLVAGWIKVEDIDDEYQNYLKGASDPLPYRVWSLYKEDWSNLDAQYKAEIQPLYDLHTDGNIGHSAKEQEKTLLDSMLWIEVQLGY